MPGLSLPGGRKTTPAKTAPARGTISGDALKYKGLGYVYGGSASRPGDWDCSSFVSYVLGHDLGMGLPGGKWGGPGMPPNAHGPVVLSYTSWAGATPVSSPQAGDLCCWAGAGPDGHIGIAISPTRMISALNPAQGTQVTPIVGTGPVGVPLVYRRVKGAAGGLGVAAGSQAQAQAGTTSAALGPGALLGLSLVGMNVVLIMAAAVLIGAAAVMVTAAAVAWLAGSG